MKPVLILNAAGDLGPQAAQDGIPAVGDWFIEAFGGPPEGFEVVDVVAGAPPETFDYAGMVVTGSPASVTERHEWLDNLKDYVRRGVDAGLPTLGVCFGHQLLADVLGGWVERHADGYEAGLTAVALTGPGRADPLFAHLPDPLPVLQLHEDVVVELPPGAKRLARNPHTDNQAFAVGARVRGVQFHPEMTPKLVAWILNERRERLAGRREVNVDAVIAELRPAPSARQVLRNWREHFCRTDPSGLAT